MKRHWVLTAILLISLAMTLLAGFLFVGLDRIVHGDLYGYGLQFSYEWAGQYWAYSRFMTESLAITVVVTSIAVVILSLNRPVYRVDYARSVYFPLLLIGIATTGLSAFFLTKMDYVVNSDLYRYGLYFSTEWANRYWSYLRSILFLLGFAASAIAVSFGMALASKPSQQAKMVSVVADHSRKFKWMNLVIVTLFSLGAASLTFSLSIDSSFLAMLGLGFMFWGVILLYIKPEKYVKEILLEKTALPSLMNLGRTIKEMGYKGTPIFLPPSFNDLKLCKVYVSAKEGLELPSLEEVISGEKSQFIRHTKALFFTPSGIELAALAEEKIGKTLGKGDLHYLGRKLPRLLIEDLELAENVQIEVTESVVLVKIQGSVYGEICKETGRLSKMCTSLGCPLCSAIACLLAKSTQRPITIVKDQAQEESRSIDLAYRIL